MGKSKKPFIDKKNSSTYHVLHRSQRDVGGDGTSENVLWPSPGNRKDTDKQVLLAPSSNGNTLGEWKQQAAEAGLLDDYNYEQHLKPITGSGDFLDATTGHQSKDALRDVRSQLVDEVKEVSRQLESIALTSECMDDDVAEALFGDFEESNFEEILDDFVLTAAQEPEDAQEEEEAFDFDAHIRELMERAKKKESDEAVHIHDHAWSRQDEAFFSKAKPMHEKEGEDDDCGNFDDSLLQDFETPGVVPALGEDEERALCEKFEQTLAEYDSDEVGDLDDECEEIGGVRPLEGDAQIESALDTYLQEKKDGIFMEGTRHLPEHRRKGGSGFSALVGKNMVPVKEISEKQDAAEPMESVKEIMAQANEVLANPEMEPPPEEILIDGKSYFSERTRNPWDCESILSTYSNLDNNPVTIESRRCRKKKKGGKVAPQSVPEDEVAQIRLSNKTGLPLGVLGSKGQNDDEVDDTYVSVNKGIARKKHETAEEKKARKEAVKKERQMARMQKKMMKEAFKEEFMRRSGDVVADDVGGTSVFRYS